MSSMEGNNKKERKDISSPEEEIFSDEMPKNEKPSIEDKENNALEKILKGSILIYKDSKKGGDCLVMDTPSEENKYKFVFKHEDGSVFKLTKEQLQKLLDNGTVSLMNNQEYLQNLLAKAREYLEKEAKKGSQEHLADLLAEVREYLEKEAKKGSQEHLADLLKEIRELRAKENTTEIEDEEKNSNEEGKEEEIVETNNEGDKEEENENLETKESTEEKEQDPISEEEFNKFVNTGKVSEEIMREIARRMLKHEKLSDNQLAIYSAPKYKGEKSISEKIEDMIKEMNSENAESNSSSETKDKKEYKKGSQEHLNALLLEIDELKEKQQELKEALEENDNINSLLDAENSDEFQEKMAEIIKLENQLKERSIEKNILEHDLKYGIELQRAKERTWRKPGEAQEAKTTEGVVEDFLHEYRLNEIPEEFNNLTVEQKFFVVRSLKNRVIDIVKSDAQTQYSEELKEKLLDEVKPDKKWKQALNKVKKIGKNAWASVTKEFDMSRIEGEVFKKIRDTEEGKKLIEDNMMLLSQHMSELKIEYDEEDEDHFYTAYINSENIKNCTEEEKDTIKDFNLAANEFAQMPYEWGQLKKSSSKKKEYEKIKAEYEKAKQNIYLIKEKRETSEEKGYSMLEVMQLDNAMQMEQLLSTHPEFEKELSKFRIEADGGDGWKAAGQTGVNVLDTLTGGKSKYNNFTNKALFVGGALIRSGTRFGTAALTGVKVAGGTLSSKAAYGISTGVGLLAAPVLGATVGAIKGRFRAKETLQKNREKARYGEKDTGKQRTATVDMASLTNKLNELVEEIKSTENQAEKSKKLALLSVRIEHSMGKIESGQVNFGDQKSLELNKFNYNEALNKAIVLKASSSKEVNEEMEERIKDMLEYAGKGTSNITSKREDIFIKKQMKQAALIGAGAATAGYLLHWFGEETGWWGAPHGGVSTTHSPKAINPLIKEEIMTSKDTSISNTSSIPTIPENSDNGGLHIMPPPNAKDFTDRADRWVEKATQHINHTEVDSPEKVITQPAYKPATYEGYHAPTNLPPKPAVNETYPPSSDKENIINHSHVNENTQPNNIIGPQKPGTYKGYNQPYRLKRVTFRDLFRGRRHHGPSVSQDQEQNYPDNNSTPSGDHTNDGNIIDKKPETQLQNPNNEPSAVNNNMHSNQTVTTQDELMKKQLENEALTPIDTKKIPHLVSNNSISSSSEHLDIDKHRIKGLGKHSHESTAHIEKTHNIPNNNKINTNYSSEDVNQKTHITPESVYEDPKIPYGPEDYTGDKSIPVETLTNTDDHIHNTILENESTNTRLENTNLKTGSAVGRTDGENLSSKDDISIENNSNLSDGLLKNLNKIHKENIKHIFRRNIDTWEKIKNNPALSIWNIKEGSKEYAQLNNRESKFFDYLHKLSDITKLKPKAGTLTMNGENNEEYIKRALVKAEEEGIINKIRLG